MARRKMSLNDLARHIGISPTNLSLLKTGKVKGIRFATLSAICDVLQCDAGDILEYVNESKINGSGETADRASEVQHVR